MLFTKCVPAECVTVIVAAGLITTSSLVPGNAPVLQFAVLVQSPLPPTQETVAAVTALEKNRTAVNTAIANLRSCLFIIRICWGENISEIKPVESAELFVAQKPPKSPANCALPTR